MSRLERIANTVAAIEKLEFQGDWDRASKRSYGYSKQDIGILTNPKGVEKILKKWQTTKNTFHFYFIKKPGLRQHREIGEVTPEFVKESLGVDIKPVEGVITVIFTNNAGGESVPMTAWIMAHRIGHVLKTNFYKLFDLFDREIDGILKTVYGEEPPNRYLYYGYGSDQYRERELRKQYSRNILLKNRLLSAVGTMRSAREGRILNYFEFVYELFAQYVFSGNIKLNKVPRVLTYGRDRIYAHDEHVMDWADDMLEYLMQQCMGEFYKALELAKGKLYVM